MVPRESTVGGVVGHSVGHGGPRAGRGGMGRPPASPAGFAPAGLGPQPSNSDRATLSQLKARSRLATRSPKGVSASTSARGSAPGGTASSGGGASAWGAAAARKVVNYAKGDFDERQH